MTSRFSNRATGAAAATAIVLLVLLIVLLWTGVGQDYLQTGQKSSPRRNSSEFRVADDDSFEEDSDYMQRGKSFDFRGRTSRFFGPADGSSRPGLRLSDFQSATSNLTGREGGPYADQDGTAFTTYPGSVISGTCDATRTYRSRSERCRLARGSARKSDRQTFVHPEWLWLMAWQKIHLLQRKRGPTGGCRPRRNLPVMIYPPAKTTPSPVDGLIDVYLT